MEDSTLAANGACLSQGDSVLQVTKQNKAIIVIIIRSPQ